MIFKRMPRTKLLLAMSAIAVAGAVALLAPATNQREAKPNQAGTDRYGDPLPPGAVARLGSLRFCHGAPVDDVTLTPDGKWVASTAKDGNRLWDTATGREVPLGDGLKHAFLFVARGKLLAAQQGPRGTKVRDVVTAEETPVAAEEITAARSRNRRDDRVLSPDGTIRAEADGGRINFGMPAPPEACRIRLWDVGSGQELPPLEKQQPDYWGSKEEATLRLAFSPDSKLLASTHWMGNTVRLWDIATRREIRQFRARERVSRVVFSADGKTLAGADGVSVTLWDVATGQWRHEHGHTSSVYALAFTADGKTLISGGWSDPVIRLWNWKTGQETAHWRTSQKGVTALAVSPDGRVVASCSQHELGTVRLWDAHTGREMGSLGDDKDFISWVAFSAEGTTLLASGAKGVRLWDMRSRTARGRIDGGMAVSLGGQTLAAGGPSQKEVRLWDLVGGREIGQVAGETYAVALAPEGRLLAVADVYGRIHLWDPPANREIRVLGERIKPGPESGYFLRALAFSPDGRTLAAGCPDRTVRLWDVASGQERARFKGHRNGVTCLAFSPDGNRLASGSEDRTIVVWDVASRKTAGPHGKVRGKD